MLTKGDSCYFFEKEDGIVTRLTNFIISGGYICEDGENSSTFIEIEYSGIKFSGIFESKHLSSVQGFRDRVTKINPILSVGNVNIVQLNEIKLLEFQQFKTAKIYSYKGLTENGEFITSDGVYIDKIFYPFDENNIADLGASKIIFKEKEKTNIELSESERICPIEDFRSIFCGHGGDFILGFMVSSLFVKKGENFPILSVIGRRQSGKTAGIKKAMTFLGATELPSENIEESTIAVDIQDLGSLRNYPLWRDEFKNSPKMSLKNGVIKGVFDRKGVSKGKYDEEGLGKNEYPVNATLIISGEEQPTDEAVLSRCCMIEVHGDRVDDRWDEISAKDYSGNLRYLLDNLDHEKYRKILAEVWKLFPMKGRPREIYSPVIAGYLYYTGEKSHIKDEWTALINIKKELEEANDVVQEFFDKIEYLQQTGKNTFWNEIRETDEGLWIYYKVLYLAYNDNVKYGDRRIEKSSIKRILESDYGAVQRSRRIDGKIINGILLTKNHASISELFIKTSATF